MFDIWYVSICVFFIAYLEIIICCMLICYTPPLIQHLYMNADISGIKVLQYSLRHLRIMTMLLF